MGDTVFFADKNQTVYVWADALLNYATVLDYPDGENFKKFWPVDLHIIGAEINKFHSIFGRQCFCRPGSLCRRKFLSTGFLPSTDKR